MRGVRTIIGVAAVIALAIVGYFLLSQQEEPSGPKVVEVAPSEAPEPHEAESPTEAAREAPEPHKAESPTEVAREVPEPHEAETPSAAAREAPEPQGSETPTEAARPAPAPKAVATAPIDQPDVERPAAAAPRPETPAETGRGSAQVPPSFDIVRAEPSGEAVIAGRAMPGSAIAVLDGERRLGRVTADWRGQWVLVLDVPLSPGSHELSLEATTGDGEVLLSKNVVVVSIPGRQVAVADGDSVSAPATPEPAAPAQQTQAIELREAGRDRETPAGEESADEVAPASSPAPTVQPEQPAQTAAVEAVQTAAGADLPAPMAAELERPLAVLVPRDGIGPSRVLQQSERLSEGLGEGPLILETIDYDLSGTATVGGRAEPGARLIVYVDGRPLGQTVAGANGRWALMLDRRVSPGLHRLRVDQIDAGGKVTARVETPFARVAMMAALPDETSVIVQPGNSLWRIARRVYGRGLRYTVIYEANKEHIRDPDLIHPGQIFVIPPTE